SEGVISQISRLAGADAVHLGSILGGCVAQHSWHPAILALQSPLQKIPSCMIVVEGNINISNIADNILAFGQDVMIEGYSGIVGYPYGALKGAKIIRKVVDEIHPDMTVEEVKNRILRLAKRDRDVFTALEHFRYSPL
ncbi:MAG TPA: hypothetical protein ENK35_03270, partial [Candidatus Tenderia sp.]|nr:hypothetical protein [Candidatus Tenderia sp.]